MKTKRYLAIILGTVLVACSEPDVFYSTSYPIVKVEASITADAVVTPPPTEGGASTTEDNPIVKVIEEDVLTMAPMQAGGKYTLDFTQYNGGPLLVNTTADAETVTGIFIKTPGSDTLQFRYGIQNYTCKVSTYKDELNATKVVLMVDFTKFYQTLYPNDKIKKVLRMEYTSANLK